MDESILKMHDKTTLRNLAVDKGLTSSGFNGRNISRMRKQDFIDFILYKERSLPSPSNNLEDEILNIVHELIMDDSFQPIIHIMGSLGLVEGIHVFSRANSLQDESPKEPERVPNEEDENAPTFSLQDLQKCSGCEVCQKNNDIIRDNSKVLEDLEIKTTCVVCLQRIRNIILAPCNHLATCITCSKNPLLKKCPLCRKEFTAATRVFY